MYPTTHPDTGKRKVYRIFNPETQQFIGRGFVEGQRGHLYWGKNYVKMALREWKKKFRGYGRTARVPEDIAPPNWIVIEYVLVEKKRTPIGEL